MSDDKQEVFHEISARIHELNSQLLTEGKPGHMVVLATGMQAIQMAVALGVESKLNDDAIRSLVETLLDDLRNHIQVATAHYRKIVDDEKAAA